MTKVHKIIQKMLCKKRLSVKLKDNLMCCYFRKCRLHYCSLERASPRDQLKFN